METGWIIFWIVLSCYALLVCCDLCCCHGACQDSLPTHTSQLQQQQQQQQQHQQQQQEQQEVVIVRRPPICHERSVVSNTGCQGRCTDFIDLTRKMRCILNFVAKECSSKDYDDTFLPFFLDPPRATDAAPAILDYKRDVKLFWYPYSSTTDKRNHEGILRRSFPDYNMEIHKLPLYWEVVISTPSAAAAAAMDDDDAAAAAAAAAAALEPPRKKIKITSTNSSTV